VWCKLTSGLLHVVKMGSCNARIDQLSTDGVVDLLLSCEDSDLSVPHIQPLLSLACKTVLNVH